MRLQENAVDQIDIDRSTGGSSDGFEHRGQTEVATPAQDAVGGANDQLGRGFGKRVVSQSDAIKFAMDKVAHAVVMQPLCDHRISHSTLDILIHGQIQIGEQLHLADQDQVVVLGKILQHQAKFAEVVHVRQVRVINDRHQHVAGAIKTERLFDEPTFALEGGTFARDPKRFTGNLDRVGIGVQRSRDRGHEVLFFGQPFERFLDDRLPVQGLPTTRHSPPCWQWTLSVS